MLMKGRVAVCGACPNMVQGIPEDERTKHNGRRWLSHNSAGDEK